MNKFPMNAVCSESTAMIMKTCSRVVLLVMAICSTAALARADEPKAQPSRPAAAPDREAAEVAAALKESWPDHPEWVDMLTDILVSRSMGPNDGWFRTAVAQVRFDWAWALKRFDKSGDGQIDRREFTGGDQDFTRLDRDRDGRLTTADFDFSGSALEPTPGAMLFARADRDANGKVTREEIDAFFKACDSGGQGFLSLADLTEALTPPPRRSSGGSGWPTKATLVRGLFRQEIGSLEPGPKLGETGPDFQLKTNDGAADISLSSLVGPKPVVLVFGNFTCGPFRSHAGNLEKLYHRFKDRASFVMVYVREAHPTDGWRMESNDRVNVATPQPRNYGERVQVAQLCADARTGLPDARRYHRRRRRRSLQRNAGPPLLDRSARQGGLQERARPVLVQTRRAGAVADPATRGTGARPRPGTRRLRQRWKGPPGLASRREPARKLNINPLRRRAGDMGPARPPSVRRDRRATGKGGLRQVRLQQTLKFAAERSCAWGKRRSGDRLADQRNDPGLPRHRRGPGHRSHRIRRIVSVAQMEAASTTR